MKILAIDPGKDKAGLAVVDDELGVLYKSVQVMNGISEIINALYEQHAPNWVLIGDGTNSKIMADICSHLYMVQMKIVDETNSTLRARKKYFQENPPRGLRKLFPVSIQTPQVAIDDYAAIVLAEDFINQADKS